MYLPISHQVPVDHHTTTYTPPEAHAGVENCDLFFSIVMDVVWLIWPKSKVPSKFLFFEMMITSRYQKCTVQIAVS